MRARFGRWRLDKPKRNTRFEERKPVVRGHAGPIRGTVVAPRRDRALGCVLFVAAQYANDPGVRPNGIHLIALLIAAVPIETPLRDMIQHSDELALAVEALHPTGVFPLRFGWQTVRLALLSAEPFAERDRVVPTY